MNRIPVSTDSSYLRFFEIFSQFLQYSSIFGGFSHLGAPVCLYHLAGFFETLQKNFKGLNLEYSGGYTTSSLQIKTSISKSIDWFNWVASYWISIEIFQCSHQPLPKKNPNTQIESRYESMTNYSTNSADFNKSIQNANHVQSRRRWLAAGMLPSSAATARRTDTYDGNLNASQWMRPMEIRCY